MKVRGLFDGALLSRPWTLRERSRVPPRPERVIHRVTRPRWIIAGSALSPVRQAYSSTTRSFYEPVGKIGAKLVCSHRQAAVAP
jgi:hypothetical protein